MRAAVVSQFDTAPRYEEFPSPTAEPGQLVVDLVAAGLHPRVRSQANGSHYSSTGVLPLVPGVDGVGRDSDGRLRYFVLADTTLGSMAAQTVIDPRRSVVLPADTDPIAVAAGMNPAMSSWVALRRRIEFAAGQRVLVLGATGNAGRLAVPIARRLGASRVVAIGRNADALAALDADDTVQLAQPDTAERLGAAATDVDVVLDYVWGDATADALRAIIPARADDTQRLAWVQIGSMGGLTAPIPSAALRAARLEIVGSGQGSVSARDIVAELPELAALISSGALPVRAQAVPLADVERVWTQPAGAERIVLTP